MEQKGKLQSSFKLGESSLRLQKLRQAALMPCALLKFTNLTSRSHTTSHALPLLLAALLQVLHLRLQMAMQKREERMPANEHRQQAAGERAGGGQLVATMGTQLEGRLWCSSLLYIT